MFSKIMKRCLIVLVIAIPIVCIGSVYANDYSTKIVEIETRANIKQKFLLITAPNPAGTIVLFEGGVNPLKLKEKFGKPKIDSIMENGFLMRTRYEYVKQGFNVAAIDAPSDQKKLDLKFRMSNNHAADIESLAVYLKKEFKLPVWLVGMSAGTISSISCAIQLQENIDGVVTFSAVTRSRKKWDIYESHPNCILDLQLDKIKVPVLIVYHKKDKCDATPPADAEKFKTAIFNSTNVKVNMFEGGKTYYGEYKEMARSCGPYSSHGYYGIEVEVVKFVSDYIKSIYQ